MTEPFAAGREADVFALDEGRVLRRYRTDADTAGEAEVMAYAAGLGFPAFTALILAQVAIGSIEHSIGARAGELLDRFLHIAPGDPLRLLDDAAAIRRRYSALSADEVAALGVAAARVRGVH